MGDWGYSAREPLYLGLTLAGWKTMLETEDPDDRAVREAHGFGFRTPDHPDGTLCLNGCGMPYGEIMACKMHGCLAVTG